MDSFDADVAAYQDMLFSLPEPAIDQGSELLTTSVTGLVTYSTCPKQFFWKEIDRLPRRPSSASRRGVEVHRKIELHHLGAVPLTDLDTVEYDDVAHVGGTSGAWSTFLESRFADMRPRSVETAFALHMPAGTVRGRIDAIFGDDRDGGHWEIVDYKSGRPSPNPAKMRQLEAYALAAADGLLGPPPGDLAVTFAYLGGDGLTEERHPVDDEWLANARTSIESSLAAIAADDFTPTPGPPCHGCDFLNVCQEGQTFVSTVSEQPGRQN